MAAKKLFTQIFIYFSKPLRLLYFTQIFIYFYKPLRLLYSLIIYEIVIFLHSLLFATSFFLSISEKCSYIRDCSCTSAIHCNHEYPYMAWWYTLLYIILYKCMYKCFGYTLYVFVLCIQ